MKLILIMVLSLVISACATKSPNDVVAVKAGDDYYKIDPATARAIERNSGERISCTRRAVVGSNKKQRICTTQSELDKERNLSDHIKLESQKIKAQEVTVGRGG